MKILFSILLFCFGIASAQTVIEGTTVNNTVTGSWEGVNISRGSKINFIYRNNSVTSVNTGGYQLQAGDEVVTSSNHNLDGEIISGNKFVYNGSHAAGSEQSITHGIFTGFQSNVVIKWNYIEKTPMSVIRKANGYMDIGGGVTYNVFKNPYATGIVCKGMGGVRIYNNTFYSDQPGYSSASSGTWRGIIDIYENPELGGTSSGVKIKNNIFYTKNQIVNIYIYEQSGRTNFDCDYNVYYCESGSPQFRIVDTYYSFAQWQTLGYDTHSVVVNPNFNNTTDLVPSVRLNYGTNLGTDYQTGLSTTATWVVGTTPATANQDASWQVGAKLYGSTAPPVDRKKYVSVTGSDANNGSITSPWLTLQKGFTSLIAGDTLYIRGGVFQPIPTNGSGDGGTKYCGVYVNGKNGSAASVYKVMNYPGESPVLDCATITGTTYSKSGILLNNCSYWYIKGIEVKNAVQASNGKGGNGVELFATNHITLVNIVSHNNGGPGFQSRVPNGDENSWINCDAYANWDQYTAGGDADGWDIGYASSWYIQRLSGCRSWQNSDDGFDMFNGAGYPGTYFVTNCWTWQCGYQGSNLSAIGGDGNGVKAGLEASNTTTRRIVTNCVSVNNRLSGFNQNEAACKQVYYNNISYGNHDYGWNFYTSNTYNEYVNNISLEGTNFVSQGAVNRNNSWNSGFAASTSDFVSLDVSQLLLPRKADGSLPEITLLHLVGTSQLIDKGFVVGLPYLGAAPDLGAFEYVSGATPPHSTLGKLIKSNGKLIIKK